MEKRDDVCYTKVIEHLLRRCKCSVLEIRLWDDGYGTMSKLHAIDSNSHSVDVWCNGKPVFLHKVEYRYHEALVHVPMSQLDSCQKVLILGGGDGMAVSIVSVSVNSFFCVSSSACLLSRFCS